MNATLLGLCLAAYAAAGIGTGLAFVVSGAKRMAPGAALTGGARVMIFPGAAVLWPYVLYRWLSSGSRS